MDVGAQKSGVRTHPSLLVASGCSSPVPTGGSLGDRQASPRHQCLSGFETVCTCFPK